MACNINCASSRSDNSKELCIKNSASEIIGDTAITGNFKHGTGTNATTIQNISLKKFTCALWFTEEIMPLTRDLSLTKAFRYEGHRKQAKWKVLILCGKYMIEIKRVHGNRNTMSKGGNDL